MNRLELNVEGPAPASAAFIAPDGTAYADPEHTIEAVHAADAWGPAWLTTDDAIRQIAEHALALAADQRSTAVSFQVLPAWENDEAPWFAVRVDTTNVGAADPRAWLSLLPPIEELTEAQRADLGL